MLTVSFGGKFLALFSSQANSSFYYSHVCGEGPLTHHVTLVKTNKGATDFTICTLTFTGGGSSDRAMQFLTSASSRPKRTPLFFLLTTIIVSPEAGGAYHGMDAYGEQPVMQIVL